MSCTGKEQVRAAEGAPVTWYFAEQGAADFARALFKREGLDINVVHTAPK